MQDRIDSVFTIPRDDSFAYPKPGYPSFAGLRSAPGNHFSYSARITVPKGLTVANGGRLEGTDARGDQVTFRFSNLKPAWRMDFAIAKYTELSSGRIRVYHLLPVQPLVRSATRGDRPNVQRDPGRLEFAGRRDSRHPERGGVPGPQAAS